MSSTRRTSTHVNIDVVAGKGLDTMHCPAARAVLWHPCAWIREAAIRPSSQPSTKRAASPTPTEAEAFPRASPPADLALALWYCGSCEFCATREFFNTPSGLAGHEYDPPSQPFYYHCLGQRGGCDLLASFVTGQRKANTTRRLGCYPRAYPNTLIFDQNGYKETI